MSDPRKIQILRGAKVAFVGDDIGFTVPGTDGQISLFSEIWGCDYGWRFFATRSGLEIPVWDERPQRIRFGGGCTPGGDRYWVPDLLRNIAIAQGLHREATRTGIYLWDSDCVAVTEALGRVDFVVLGPPERVICRVASVPLNRKKRPRVSQKILDGGEDMTI